VGADGVRTNIVKEPVPPSKKYTDQFRYGTHKVVYMGNEYYDDLVGYIYNDMLFAAIMSEGPIIDRGSYFEVQNAVFMGHTHYLVSDTDWYEMFKTTVYVRKNAVGTLYSNKSDKMIKMTKTAEQCFNDSGGKLLNDEYGHSDIVLYTECEGYLNEYMDNDGYIIKFDDIMMHSS
jgi:hypothetical protein